MNNFDQSSKGVNLELNCFSDGYLSRDRFEDNFKRLDCGKWLFTDNGQMFDDNYNVSKIIDITGYSQGDHASVIVPTKLGYSRKFNFKSYFENLFFDAPLHCCLIIDDIEFNIHYEIKDEYNYDIDEIMNIASNQLMIFNHPKKEYILEWLKENLPLNADYQG